MLLTVAGCGTTRSTDTTRAATEMLLVSQAIDKAVGQLDFSPLANKTVYLDTTSIDTSTVDKGYLVSSVRQQLLAHGALLMDDRARAVYVVETRIGAVGTDRHTLLVGTPQLSVPAIVPGLPTNIPEIALYKRNDQKGVAKLAVFAYNRITGRAVWQSGLVEDVSRQKDRWVLGSGPYTNGTIRRGTELAGEDLSGINPIPLIMSGDAADVVPPLAQNPGQPLSPDRGFQWQTGDNPPPPQPVPISLISLTGAAAVINHPLLVR